MSHDRDAPVWEALRALGIEDMPIMPLGAGLASEAWRVGVAAPWLALRLARDDRGARSFPVEHALAARLRAAGAEVPEPVSGSWEVPGWSGPAFSVMRGLEGASATPGDRAVVVAGLAAFLACQWAVEPLPGFGPLTLQDGGLRGRSASLPDGLRAWADRSLWPVDGPSLAMHPALAGRDDLRRPMEALAAQVLATLVVGPAVLVHADLHEENLLVDGSTLHVIDLGETFLGPRAWDLAAIGYFLGWEVADAVTAALSPDPRTDAVPRRQDIDLVALVVGAYRWSLDRDLGADEDVHDAGFLHQTLGRIRGAPPNLR